MSKQKSNNSTTAIGIWIGIFVITIVVIVGLALVSQKNGGQKDSSVKATLSVEVNSSDRIRGNPMSRTTLVEYSDFQCPACAAYYPFLKKLDAEYGNRIQVVYRNFPLKQLHKNAYLAAQAAQAAGKQGKFWEMHDMLFEHQSEWSELPNAKERFGTFAQELKLDRTAFEKDLDAKEVKDTIENDLKSGESSGIQGTPTFYLNGTKIDNPRSYDEFKQVIDTALEIIK